WRRRRATQPERLGGWRRHGHRPLLHSVRGACHVPADRSRPPEGCRPPGAARSRTRAARPGGLIARTKNPAARAAGFRVPAEAGERDGGGCAYFAGLLPLVALST